MDIIATINKFFCACVLLILPLVTVANAAEEQQVPISQSSMQL